MNNLACLHPKLIFFACAMLWRSGGLSLQKNK